MPRPRRPGKRVGQRYFVQVARGLGVPQKHLANAVRFLRAQQRGEGTQAIWNPLGTTTTRPGSTNFNNLGNGTGVQNFPSRAAGISATVQTYLNGHYDGIVSDLRRGVSARNIANNRLDELRTWGTGSLVAANLGSTPTPTIADTHRNPRNPPQVSRPGSGFKGLSREKRMALGTLLVMNMRGGSESGAGVMAMLPLLEALGSKDDPREKPLGRGATGSRNAQMTGRASSMVDLARQYLGTRYDWGSEPGRSQWSGTPTAFDCSGFIAWLWYRGSNGKTKLPAFTGSLVKLGKPVKGKPQVGDWLFFYDDYGHMGMYIGDNQFIHASSSGGVKITNMSDYSAPTAIRRYGLPQG